VVASTETVRNISLVRNENIVKTLTDLATQIYVANILLLLIWSTFGNSPWSGTFNSLKWNKYNNNLSAKYWTCLDTGLHVQLITITRFITYNKYLSYRRETALQGGLVMAKSGRLELRDNIYKQYRSIFNHCDVFGQQRNRNRRKNAK